MALVILWIVILSVNIHSLYTEIYGDRRTGWLVPCTVLVAMSAILLSIEMMELFQVI